MKSMFKVFGVIALATTLAACSGMSRSQKNTAIGAAVGGVAGNVIGGSIIIICLKPSLTAFLIA